MQPKWMRQHPPIYVLSGALFARSVTLSALRWESLGLPFRPFRYILGHKKVPYGDAPIEVAEVFRAGELGQLVVPDRLFPVMIGLALRLAQWLPHNPLPARIA